MCWEDPNLVLSALDISEKDTVLSIASGGENLFAILLKDPKKLIAIDTNPYQLYLVKLKIAAIKSLNFTEFVEFIGIKSSKKRLNYFCKCKQHLSKKEIEFWKKNISYIQEGLLFCGKFESYLNLFRKYVLSLVLSKNKIKKFLSSRTLAEQEIFYSKHWNNLIWKLVFRVFFSKTIMQILGRDKEYFKQNKIKNISYHYYNRAYKGIVETPIANNYFDHMILTGSIPVPFKSHPYLNPENFEKLKKIADKIEFVNEDILNFIENSNKQINKYNLSDIFEKYSQKTYESVISLISKKSQKGTKICYWNNLVERKNHHIKNMVKDIKKSKELFNQDRVFFYSDFIVEEKH